MDFSSFENKPRKQPDPDNDVTPCGFTSRQVAQVLIARLDELGFPYGNNSAFWKAHADLCTGCIIRLKIETNDTPKIPKKKRTRKPS